MEEIQIGGPGVAQVGRLHLTDHWGKSKLLCSIFLVKHFSLIRDLMKAVALM
jgi:hypothetical protein